MKSKVVIPVVSALLGSLITGGALIAAQIIEQHYETTRRLQMLAYEMAMKEWEVRATKAPESAMPDFGGILLEHLEHSYVARKYGPDKESEKYAGVILDKMLEDRFWNRVREVLSEEENAIGGESTSQEKTHDGKASGAQVE